MYRRRPSVPWRLLIYLSLLGLLLIGIACSRRTHGPILTPLVKLTPTPTATAVPSRTLTPTATSIVISMPISTLWTRQFGSADSDDALGVAVDGAGNLYMVGGVGSALPGQTNSGVSDAFVSKYNSDGNELWIRQFGAQTTDEATGVAVDNAGHLYVVGLTDGSLPGQASLGGVDAFVMKMVGSP